MNYFPWRLKHQTDTVINCNNNVTKIYSNIVPRLKTECTGTKTAEICKFTNMSHKFFLCNCYSSCNGNLTNSKNILHIYGSKITYNVIFSWLRGLPHEPLAFVSNTSLHASSCSLAQKQNIIKRDRDRKKLSLPYNKDFLRHLQFALVLNLLGNVPTNVLLSLHVS